MIDGRFFRIVIDDKLRDCSGRSGKWAHKVEGSARLLLPLHDGARKGMFRFMLVFLSVCFHFLIPLSTFLREGKLMQVL